MKRLGLACARALCATSVAAEVEVRAMRYTCERGVEVPVVYVNAGTDAGIAVIQVEGGMFNLQAETSASGVRYGFPSDGSHYVWWTNGDAALLLWHDGTTGQDAPIYNDCTLQK